MLTYAGYAISLLAEFTNESYGTKYGTPLVDVETLNLVTTLLRDTTIGALSLYKMCHFAPWERRARKIEKKYFPQIIERSYR